MLPSKKRVSVAGNAKENPGPYCSSQIGKRPKSGEKETARSKGQAGKAAEVSAAGSCSTTQHPGGSECASRSVVGAAPCRATPKRMQRVSERE